MLPPRGPHNIIPEQCLILMLTMSWRASKATDAICCMHHERLIADCHLWPWTDHPSSSPSIAPIPCCSLTHEPVSLVTSSSRRRWSTMPKHRHHGQLPLVSPHHRHHLKWVLCNTDMTLVLLPHRPRHQDARAAGLPPTSATKVIPCFRNGLPARFGRAMLIGPG
jgi:hypothetical protein